MDTKLRILRPLVVVMIVAVPWATATVRGQNDSPVETIFPVVADVVYGEQPDATYFDTVFTVFNASATTERVVLSLFEDDGQPFDTDLAVGAGIAHSGHPFAVKPGTLKYI